MPDDTDFDTTPDDDGSLAAVWDNLSTDQPNGNAHEQAMPAIDAPSSWSAPMRQRLSTLPSEYRDVVEYIAKRDKESGDAISRAGNERKQLEERYGPLAAAYEPLKGVLDQHQDVFDHYGLTPHQTVESLLRMERMLRTDPNAISELAKAYGRELPGAEHVNTLQGQLSEVTQRESKRELDEFMKGKEYFSNVNFQSAVASEMRQLQKDAPGLKGTALLRLAHDRVAERAGITKQIEHQREQEQAQKMAARDSQWMQYLQTREAEQLKREMDRDAQRQRENQEKTRMAKRASAVNTKGSPGHGTINPKSVEDTLRETWDRIQARG